jgi:hypothetical protein
MKCFEGLRNAFIPSLLLWSLIIWGCAGMTAGIKTGLTALQVIDSFYNYVVEAKTVPNTLQAATLILQQADLIAAQAKAGANTPEMIAQAKLLNDQANKL